MIKPFVSKFTDAEIEKILTLALGSERLTEAEYKNLVDTGKTEAGIWYRVYSDAQKTKFKSLYDGVMPIFVVDTELNAGSDNAICNAAVFLALSKKADVNTVSGYTINGKKISGNPTLGAADLLVGGAGALKALTILAAIEQLASNDSTITKTLKNINESIGAIAKYKINGKLVSDSPTLAALDLLVGGEMEEIKALNIQQALEKVISSMKLSDKVLLAQVSMTATLAAENDRLRALIDNGGDHHAISYDSETAYKVCGCRTVIYGHGVPSKDTIPDQQGIPAFIGQHYINIDADTDGEYYAVGTSSVSDWKK